jgi:hypothetical protein
MNSAFHPSDLSAPSSCVPTSTGRNKTLLSALLTATVLLTACGGSVLDFRNAEISNGKLYKAGADAGFTGTVTNIPHIKLLSSQPGLAQMNRLLRTTLPHNTVFDPQAVKKKLGIAVSGWDGFMYRMKQLAERKVKHAEAERFLCQVLAPATLTTSAQGSSSRPAPVIPGQVLKKIQSLYDGHGRGAELGAAKGTAWGLLCAVTEYVDHERRARSVDHRLDSAWFGQGAGLKHRALEAALALTA